MKPARNSSAVPLLLLINQVALWWASSRGFACDWTYYLNVEGHQVESDFDSVASFIAHLKTPEKARQAWEKARVEAEQKAQATSDFKWKSDYAVTLMHLGDASKAIEILSEIERSNPGQYVVAANLGTAYELSGDNEKALEWIQEGMRRNPESHHGTEWLHVRILQAKLEIARDPTWLETHSVLGIDFGQDAKPARPNLQVPFSDGETRDWKAIQKAVTYQLHERLAFVAPPDPIVGDLLFDLGNLLAFNEGVGFATSVYTMSLDYKPVHSDLVARRREFVSTLPTEPAAGTTHSESNPVSPSATIRHNWTSLTLLAGSVGLMAICLVLKARKQKS